MYERPNEYDAVLMNILVYRWTQCYFNRDNNNKRSCFVHLGALRCGQCQGSALILYAEASALFMRETESVEDISDVGAASTRLATALRLWRHNRLT